jgi:hypothetical protein
VQPEFKGLRTRPRLSPTPCKNKKNQHRIKGHNPIEDLCPLIEQKIKKIGGFWRSWVSGGLGIKWGFWEFGWPAVVGYGGDWPAVVFWWWVRRWVVVGWCGFGFWGGEGRRRGKGGCTAGGENGGRRKKSDLKAGLDGPKTEYVRTYKGTFDRTRAGACVCEAACVRTYASTFERTRAVQWV